MEDSASKAVRGKRDSSIRVACRLVRDGDAEGVVSAGNTGAVMVTAKLVLGMLPGVDRPALAQAFPTLTQARRHVGCGSQRGLRAAHAGSVRRDGRRVFRAIFQTASPRVGLLSIGEEEHKATTSPAGLRAAQDFAPELRGKRGGRMLQRRDDVVVCDGFIGNVALRSARGWRK